MGGFCWQNLAPCPSCRMASAREAPACTSKEREGTPARLRRDDAIDAAQWLAARRLAVWRRSGGRTAVALCLRRRTWPLMCRPASFRGSRRYIAGTNQLACHACEDGCDWLVRPCSRRSRRSYGKCRSRDVKRSGGSTVRRRRRYGSTMSFFSLFIRPRAHSQGRSDPQRSRQMTHHRAAELTL